MNKWINKQLHVQVLQFTPWNSNRWTLLGNQTQTFLSLLSCYFTTDLVWITLAVFCWKLTNIFPPKKNDKKIWHISTPMPRFLLCNVGGWAVVPAVAKGPNCILDFFGGLGWEGSGWWWWWWWQVIDINLEVCHKKAFFFQGRSYESPSSPGRVIGVSHHRAV